MKRIITWALEADKPDVTPHETNSLFYAEDFIRYFKYKTPYSIKYCIEGEMTYIVGGERLTVRPNNYFITNHDTEIECLPVSEGTKALIIFFTKEFIRDIADSFSGVEGGLEYTSKSNQQGPEFFEQIYRSTNPLSTQIQSLAHQMNAGRNDTDPSHLAHVFYHLAENLLSLNGQTQHQLNNLNARNPGTRKELYRRVVAARDFMQDQWEHQLSLNDVARHACLSPFHFHRSFQAVFGDAPMLWFRKMKLEKASELLLQDNMTVSEVAMHCGFGDVFSFSKAFKRTWGISPSGYQQKVERPYGYLA